MANALKGEAFIALSDGRRLHVAYDFDGLIALEEAAGMRMSAVYAELQRLQATKQAPSLRLTRAILYGGLQQHHPEITLKEVGDIILGDTDAINQAFVALQGAHGPASDEGGQAGEAEPGPLLSEAGTGVISSKAGAEPVLTP